MNGYLMLRRSFSAPSVLLIGRVKQGKRGKWCQEQCQEPFFGRPYLEAIFAESEPGTEYVITRYRDVNSNLRTQFGRIIRRAGLTPWPKLFQNLRASRQMELSETFPAHVVCAWLGNSVDVAREHYLQVTDLHF